jgi:hypothetical protein
MKRLSIAFRCFFSLLFKGKISETLLAELRTRMAAPSTEASAASTEAAGPFVAPRPAERGQVTGTRPPGEEARAPDGTERAVQMLALLQRDGRLVDFFTEDIGEYDDAQVGAAVRDMHESCRNTLNRYLTLQPVIAGEEGKPITVEGGFDPGTIKLIGNVTGRLPVRGVLRHHGWRAGDIRLPDVPTGASRAVIAPAEVEVS